jgi:hypothetical protein
MVTTDVGEVTRAVRPRTSWVENDPEFFPGRSADRLLLCRYYGRKSAVFSEDNDITLRGLRLLLVQIQWSWWSVRQLYPVRSFQLKLDMLRPSLATSYPVSDHIYTLRQTSSDPTGFPRDHINA